MNTVTFTTRLRDRASAAGAHVPASLFDPLHAFYELLVKWNARVNLTALPLDGLPDRTIDRLFIEPLAAAPLLLDLPTSAWFDIGSGGGSPAVPLALARPDLRLTMVESRERKASFLREVVRELDLRADVEAVRLGQLLTQRANSAGLVSMRGVRLDEALAGEIGVIASAGATVVAFGSDPVGRSVPKLELTATHRLTDEAFLHSYRVPRGTNR